MGGMSQPAMVKANGWLNANASAKGMQEGSTTHVMQKFENAYLCSLWRIRCSWNVLPSTTESSSVLYSNWCTSLQDLSSNDIQSIHTLVRDRHTSTTPRMSHSLRSPVSDQTFPRPDPASLLVAIQLAHWIGAHVEPPLLLMFGDSLFHAVVETLQVWRLSSCPLRLLRVGGFLYIW
jgi:hypothetical protein